MANQAKQLLLQKLRLEYKKKFQNTLNTLNTENEFKKLHETLGLTRYKIEIAQPHHTNEIVSILGATFSSTNILAQVLKIKPSDVEYAKTKQVMFGIKCGKCLIVINTNTKKIEAGAVFTDLLDVSAATIDAKGNVRYIKEMMMVLYDHYQKNNTNDKFAIITQLSNNTSVTDIRQLYGNYIHGGTGFVVPKAQNKKLMMLLSFAGHTLIRRIGYKCIVGETFHPRAQQITDMFGYQMKSKINLTNFIFNDSTRMMDKLDAFQKEKNYSNSQMDELKKDLQITLSVCDITKMNMLIPSKKPSKL